MKIKKILIISFLISSFSTLANATSLLRIVGSSAVFPFAATVAEHLSYKTNISVPLIEGIGTGAGIKLFCGSLQGPDGAITSRPMTAKEKKQCQDHGIFFKEFKVGQDGLILIQSHQATPFSLNLTILASALLQTIPKEHECILNPYQSWDEIKADLPSYPIKVIGPAPTSGTYDVLVEAIEGPCGSLLRQDGQYVEAPANENLIIQKVLNAPQRVGIVTFSFYEQNKNKLRAMPINDVRPTLASIQKGTYLLSRPLFLYIKTNPNPEFPNRKAYVMEFTSNAAIGDKGYLTKKGLVPLYTDEQKVMHDRATSLTPERAL